MGRVSDIVGRPEPIIISKAMELIKSYDRKETFARKLKPRNYYCLCVNNYWRLISKDCINWKLLNHNLYDKVVGTRKG